MAIPNSDMRLEISFAWWNTSLAPRARTRDDKNLRAMAIEVVRNLLDHHNATFVALGEMSLEDIAHLKTNIPDKHLHFEAGITSVGRTTYDNCYIFNKNIFDLITIKDISFEDGGRNLKIAQNLILLEKISGKYFSILASHWPSRIAHDEFDPIREQFGLRLRDTFLAITQAEIAIPNVILLGDYNDEPYSRSLSHQLKASRHRALVGEKDHLLYNPFWGFLGRRDESPEWPLGTYYWKDGNTTKWYTFDQIMVSSSLARGDDWNLVEKGAHLVNIKALTNLVQKRSSKFDHIPVLATLERTV